jgi:MoaA/NifB/PqqE/SkfB family radical SAM enzyme
MIKYQDIRHIHLEISTRCNAACPDCPRNLRGVDVVEDYPLHDMRLEEAKQIFPPAFVKQLWEVYINGNLGDMVTARDALGIIEYFKECNPNLRIYASTNAGAKTEKFWQRLAELRVEVFFCIDGLKGTHELYRQNTQWDTVIRNARAFISAGGNATWKMIKFDHNLTEEDACRELAIELGFKKFQYIDHGRNAFPVFDNKGTFKHDIGTHSQPRDFQVLHFHREENKREFKIPEFNKTPIKCWSKENRSVYVTATGEVYPCCWMGFFPGKMYHQGNEEIVPLMTTNNNALEVGTEAAISWFNNVEQTFKSNQTYICHLNCSQ